MEKKPTKKVPVKPAVIPDPPFDPYAAVLLKYQAEGWDAIRSPGGIVDVIARKDETKEVKGIQKVVKTKFHFVQVLTPESENDIKFRGEPKNSFIQNAFSNGAEPVHAFVTRSRAKNPDAAMAATQPWIQKIKITFRNINSDSSIRV